MPSRYFLTQRSGLQYLDPRPHAHYPVRQLRRTLDGHRHDRRTVAAMRKTLTAMNRARSHVCLGLFVMNLQLDFGLGAVNNSESPFSMCRRIEPARKDESRRGAVGLTNKFDRADSFDRQVNDRLVPMAMT